MKLYVISTLKNGLHLLKENPKILVPLTASIAFWLLVVVASYDIGLEYYNTVELLYDLISLLLVWTVAGTLGYLLDNVAIRATADIALSGETCLKDALLFTLRKLPALLGAGLIYMLIVVPASLLIIPGIYLGVRLLLFSYAILIDNESALGSLKKSWSIVKGNWLRTFALLVVFAVIGFLLGYILEIENLLLWAMAGAGMVLTRGWAVATFTLAYLQLAPEPVEEDEEEEYFAMSPEEPFELQQKINELEIPLKPKPEIERKPRNDEDEEIEDILKQRKVLDKFPLPENYDKTGFESSITIQQLQTEEEDGKETKQSEELEKLEEDARVVDNVAEQAVKVSEVGVVANNTVAEETIDKVRIEGIGLRRRRLQKSKSIKHEITDKDELREGDRIEQRSKKDTKDVEECSLDGISVILRRD